MTAHIRSRGEEAKEIAREAGKRARRWVVERSHSWLNRFRRLLIRWENALPGLPAFCLWPDCFACCRVTRIGS